MVVRNNQYAMLEDDMANIWGASLANDVSFMGCTKVQLDTEIRRTIPTYRLMDMLDSGTSANERAIAYATDGNYKACLFGMGCYVGGVGVLEQYSSSCMLDNKQLCPVKRPEECDLDATKEQTIPLPYHVPQDELDLIELQRLEDKCLDAISLKLLLACLSGKPYKAFLFEFILSGTGGELSISFLSKLCAVLNKYEVNIIADEVMTGGRVGPLMTMTSSMPEDIVKSVNFITLGKCFGCGIVLEKKQLYKEYGVRGTTTWIEPDEAFAKFKAIAQRLDSGVLDAKRQRVLTLLKKCGPNEVWGHGLLIFVSRGRPSVVGNLKNRLLPALENGTKTKLQKGFTNNSKWNRKTMNDHLLASLRSWLQHTSTTIGKSMSPYTVQLAKYLFCNPLVNEFNTEQLVSYYDKNGIDSQQMVTQHKERKRNIQGARQGRCSKGHTALVRTSLKDAEQNSKGFVTSALKNKKRRLYYAVHYTAD